MQLINKKTQKVYGSHLSLLFAQFNPNLGFVLFAFLYHEKESYDTVCALALKSFDLSSPVKILFSMFMQAVSCSLQFLCENPSAETLLCRKCAFCVKFSR